MNEPRPRPSMSINPMGSRRAVTSDEVDEKYLLIKENSGIICINNVKYKDLHPTHFKHLEDLGAGTCGTVSKVALGAHTMAVKEMKRTDNKEETKRIFMDLDVIRKSNDCEYIVKCFGYIITQDHLYIYMELMAGCADRLLRERRYVGFPEGIIGKVALSVTKALNYLKENLSLMHRDIKPSNILLDWHGNVKLCDFGISGQLIDSKASSMTTGCCAYLAPERINSAQTYDIRADVWSLGITLVQLAIGRHPYFSGTDKDPSIFQLMVMIQSGEPPRLPEEGFSPEFRDFVAQCLIKEVENRPKLQTLLALPFLQRAETSDISVEHWIQNQDEYSPPPGRA